MRAPRSRVGRIGAGLIAALAIAIALWVHATHWHPATATYPIQGTDVSDAQGVIDWNTVNAHGADFAYLRATIGAEGRDARFADNWVAVDAAGMRRGAVHAWSFCETGVAQADNFVTTVPRTADALPALLALDYAPDCDARPDRAALIAQIDRFLSIAETHTGKPMLLKISRSVAADYHLAAAIPRPIWEVRNFFAPDYSARPWRMWQASDMRRIDGVAGPVNWDVVTP